MSNLSLKTFEGMWYKIRFAASFTAFHVISREWFLNYFKEVMGWLAFLQFEFPKLSGPGRRTSRGHGLQ